MNGAHTNRLATRASDTLTFILEADSSSTPARYDYGFKFSAHLPREQGQN